MSTVRFQLKQELFGLHAFDPTFYHRAHFLVLNFLKKGNHATTGVSPVQKLRFWKKIGQKHYYSTFLFFATDVMDIFTDFEESCNNTSYDTIHQGTCLHDPTTTSMIHALNLFRP